MSEKKKRKADSELTTVEIMLIDDSNVFLKLAKRQLSALGCNVIVANNSTLAMSILHKNSEKIKLILMDIIMPEVDGIQLLKQIKVFDSLRSIPVYMLSALDDDVILNKCRENGAMGVMLKPLDIKAAQRCLSSVLPAFSPRRRPTVEKSGEAASADMASTSVSSPNGASSKSSNVSSSTATSALQHDAGSAAAKKHRVLIVDDSFISSRIAQRCLQSNDYACETAKNGLEAIRTLRDTEREFSAVILDLNMPVLNGVETLTIMHHDAKLKSIPVIILAGTIDEKIVQTCRAAGAYSALLKPFQGPQILRLLNQITGKDKAVK